MAVLPGIESVGQPEEGQRRIGIGSWQPRVIGEAGQALQRGGERLGAGFDRLGSDLSQVSQEMQTRQNNLQMAQYEGANATTATQAHLDLLNATSPDAIQKIQSDATEKMKQNANMLSDPYLREMGVARSATHLATLGLAAGERLRTVNNDNAIAGVQSNIQDILPKLVGLPEAAVTSNIDTFNIMIQSLVNSGAITPQQGVEWRKRVPEEFANAKVANARLKGETTGDTSDLQKLGGFPAAPPAAPIAIPPKSEWPPEAVSVAGGGADGSTPVYLDKNGNQLPADKQPKASIDRINAESKGQGPSQNNFEAAKAALNLTPQEQNLYEHHLSNLTGPGGITLPGGARETVKQITVGIGGQTYNLPTVWDGKELSAKDAIARAKSEGLDKFPSYPTEKAAQSRYDAMHTFMDKDVAALGAGPSGAAKPTAPAPYAWHTQVGGSMAWQVQAAHTPASGFGQINQPYNLPLDAKNSYGMSAASAFQMARTAGATTNEALMLTGGAANESSFNPTAWHDNHTGYGMFGHKLDRLNLVGLSAQDQMRAALAELRRRPEDAAVNAAKTPEELVAAEMAYESPEGYRSGHPEAGHNYRGRLATMQYFSQMANGVFAGNNGAPIAGPVQRGGLGIAGRQGVHDWEQIFPSESYLPETSAPSSTPSGEVPPPVTPASYGSTGPDVSQPSVSDGGPVPPTQGTTSGGGMQVVDNGDGSFSLVQGGGGFVPPYASLPPLPKDSILNALPADKQAEMRLGIFHDIVRIQRQKEMARRRDNKEAKAALDEIGTEMSRGAVPSSDAFNKTIAPFEQSGDPEIMARAAQLKAGYGILTQLRGDSPASARAKIDTWQAALQQQEQDAPWDVQRHAWLQRAVDLGQKYVSGLEQDIRKDVLPRALADGVISELTPLDPNDPNFGASMGKRVEEAEAAASHYGLATPQYIRPNERIQFRRVAGEGGQPMVNVATGVVAGAGAKAADVFRQIGADAPAFMTIGQLALDPNADHSTAINRYTDWIAASHDKDAKKGLTYINDKTLIAHTVTDPSGNALSAFGADYQGRIREAGLALASEDATLKGTKQEDLPALADGDVQESVVKAFNQAVGATYQDEVQYGGFTQAPATASWLRGVSGPSEAYQVLTPTDMRADRFPAVIGRLTDADLARLAQKPHAPGVGDLSAEVIKNGQFVAIPNAKTGLFDGKYSVLLPNGKGEMSPVLDRNGKRWNLDLSALAKDPGFRGRIPDAFMPLSGSAPRPTYAPAHGVMEPEPPEGTQAALPEGAS